MVKHIFKFILLICIAALMAGCKLAVIVVEGGGVTSHSGGLCAEGMICLHQINDTNYSETFIAVSNPEWVFKQWNSGDGFLCQGSTDPICVVSTVGTEGNLAIEAIIASDKTFYIMPVFLQGPPITEIVEANGSVWAQANLFTNLSWTEINAVCPAPEGLCNGYLNGYDVDGWAWASIDDVFDLMVSLGHPPLTYPPSSQYGEASSEWAPAFYDLGFRQTFESAGRAYIAWTSSSDETCNSSPPACGVTASVADRADANASDFVEVNPIDIRAVSPGRGAWLHKPLSVASNRAE